MGKMWNFIKQSLHLILMLVLFSLLGFLIHFFMLLSPVFGGCYLSYKKRKLSEAGLKDEYQGKALLLRAVIIGVFFTAAFIAPVRGCSYILAHFSGYELLNEFLRNNSLGVAIDVFLGICGVCFATVAGYIFWKQTLMLKSQLANTPTATVRSASIGIIEIKGVARQIEDQAERQTVKIVSGDKKDFSWHEECDYQKSPIIHYCYDRSHRGTITEIKSRFYLEDATGRMLVDPRRAESWDGKEGFLTSPTQHFFLKEEQENRIYSVPGKKDMEKTGAHLLRQLYPGDEVYIIGSAEEYENAPPHALDHERLILRPSSTLSQPDPISRIILGGSKSTKANIFNVFFLTDILEGEARDRLTKSSITLWFWVAGWIALSLQPLLFNLSSMF